MLRLCQELVSLLRSAAVPRVAKATCKEVPHRHALQSAAPWPDAPHNAILEVWGTYKCKAATHALLVSLAHIGSFTIAFGTLASISSASAAASVFPSGGPRGPPTAAHPRIHGALKNHPECFTNDAGEGGRSPGPGRRVTSISQGERHPTHGIRTDSSVFAFCGEEDRRGPHWTQFHNDLDCSRCNWAKAYWRSRTGGRKHGRQSKLYSTGQGRPVSLSNKRDWDRTTFSLAPLQNTSLQCPLRPTPSVHNTTTGLCKQCKTQSTCGNRWGRGLGNVLWCKQGVQAFHAFFEPLKALP